MKSRKPSPPRKPEVPSQKAIIRAVASSTAIETGRSIESLEAFLRHPPQSRYSVTLAP